MQMEVGSAMWALWPLLCQPPTDTEVATQLGAVWAKVCILELLHADEATEHFSQALEYKKTQMNKMMYVQ